MKKTSFDLLVLGGGPGGIEAALQAAQKGLEVALISDQKPGGRAVWGSLVPSKVWLAAAEAAEAMRHSPFYALRSSAPACDLNSLQARIVAQSESASARHRAALNSVGVAFVDGKGRITDPHTVRVESEDKADLTLNGRFIVVAGGSEPVFSAGIKPVLPRIFAPRHAGSLPELPRTLIVVGGGVTGAEYGFAFAALGTKVTILHNGSQLLPRLDTAIALQFEHYLRQRMGIRLQKNDRVKALELREGAVLADTQAGVQYEAEYAFIATGRKADLRFYDPDRFYFPLTAEGALAVNAFCQTNHPHIFAVGDVTGTPMTANRAMMQARVAVSHMVQGEAGAMRQAPVIEMAYTHPPVGQIGDMQPEEDAYFIEKPYSGLLKAHLQGETAGLLRIKVKDRSGHISGAAVFGAEAAELLGILQLAIHRNIPYNQLSALPMAHPSYGELLTGR